MFISSFIYLIITYLLACTKQRKSSLPADCPYVIKVFHRIKGNIRWLCFLGNLIHQLAAQEIFLPRNKVSEQLKKKSADSPGVAGMQHDHSIGLTEVTPLQIRRSSSCVSLAAEPFLSWGAARVIRREKVSRMLFFSFIGKHKPVGSIFDSQRLATSWLTLRKCK